MAQEVSGSPHFVLVHGFGHGAWCWYKIRCSLQNSGCKVTCLDLAGAGINQANPDSILSFEEYNKPLIDFISALPENEKVILVGHSVGGLSLTHAIHEFGNNKISLAIYVAATMLRSGYCSEQDVDAGVPKLVEELELRYGMGRDNPPTSSMVRPEFQRDILYNLSPHEDSTLASMLLRPGPLLAVSTARFEGGKNIDGVKRVYVKTTCDRMVWPEQQESMIDMWPPEEVLVLESDHSPFFSMPDQLIDLFLKASGSICSPLEHT